MKYRHETDWLDVVMICICTLVGALFVVGMAFLDFTVIDCVGIQTSKAVAVVCGKHYSSEFDSTTVNVQKDFTYVSTTRIPETFSVRLDVGGKQSSVNVYKGIWEKAKDGDLVDVVYGYGRYTGWLYIKDAQFREDGMTEAEAVVKRITDKLKEPLRQENEGGDK